MTHQKSTMSKKVIRKGIDWVNRMKIQKLPRTDAWMSLFSQLLPRMKWERVVVVLTPNDLQRYYQDFYYKPLPLLGVNRNLGKE